MSITGIPPVGRDDSAFYGWDGAIVAGITRSVVSLSKKLMQ